MNVVPVFSDNVVIFAERVNRSQRQVKKKRPSFRRGYRSKTNSELDDCSWQELFYPFLLRIGKLSASVSKPREGL